MRFLEELRELKKVFLPWLVVWLIISFFFFGFGFQKTEIFGFNVFYPVPSLQSIAVHFFQTAARDLLPDQAQIVTLNPLNAFLALMVISLLSAFIATFPFFLYKLIRYLSPALCQKEKKAVFKVLVPAGLLFAAGCAFAYFLLIPLTFRVLYSFALVIEAEPFFYITQFVTLVLALMMAVGIMFLLPIFMGLLTKFGLVDNRFWRKNWRYAFLFFLISSAIITPDGTGITMMLLALPLTGLYFLGTIVTAKNKSK